MGFLLGLLSHGPGLLWSLCTWHAAFHHLAQRTLQTINAGHRVAGKTIESLDSNAKEGAMDAESRNDLEIWTYRALQWIKQNRLLQS